MDLASVRLRPVDKDTIDLTPQLWDGSSWKISPVNEEESSASTKRLTFLSFNLMKEKEYLVQRMNALLTIIEKYSPDFIAFQENTEKHNEILTSHNFIQKNIT